MHRVPGRIKEQEKAHGIRLDHRLPPSEEGEIPIHLVVSDAGVPVHELLPLDLGVVVDVVAPGHLAQRRSQDGVLDEVVGGVQQRRRHRLDSFCSAITFGSSV